MSVALRRRGIVRPSVCRTHPGRHTSPRRFTRTEWVARLDALADRAARLVPLFGDGQADLPSAAAGAYI
jgi:hypothetical protein